MQGMGRTAGWIVAADAGELVFRDCRGQVSLLADGRLEATIQHCAGTGRGIEVSGVVRGVDVGLGLLVVVDGGGHLRRFSVDPGRTDRPALSELAPGDAVGVTGPVAGRASGISRP